MTDNYDNLMRNLTSYSWGNKPEEVCRLHLEKLRDIQAQEENLTFYSAEAIGRAVSSPNRFWEWQGFGAELILRHYTELGVLQMASFKLSDKLERKGYRIPDDNEKALKIINTLPITLESALL
jgi:hypothetical protein